MDPVAGHQRDAARRRAGAAVRTGPPYVTVVPSLTGAPYLTLVPYRTGRLYLAWGPPYLTSGTPYLTRAGAP